MSAADNQGIHCRMKSDKTHILGSPITKLQMEVEEPMVVQGRLRRYAVQLGNWKSATWLSAGGLTTAGLAAAGLAASWLAAAGLATAGLATAGLAAAGATVPTGGACGKSTEASGAAGHGQELS